MFKYVLFLVLSTSFLSAETLSYSDLLKRSEPEQKVALEEASHVFSFNDYEFHSLEGGLTRAKLYRFGAKCKTYVLRFLALGGSQTKDLRLNEIEAQKIGYELGIAPEVTFSDQNGVLMIIPYIDGHKLHSPSTSQLLKLGQMIRSLHSFKGIYPVRYTIKDRLELQYQKGVKNNVAYPTGFENEISTVINAPYCRSFVPNHSDLNPSNILVTSSGITLIDWTTATLDDPMADLSFFSALSNLTVEEDKLLLEAYLSHPPTQEELETLQKEKANVYLLTATIWLRFSETPEEKLLPLEKRVASLDATLNSDDLMTVDQYLEKGIVIDLNNAPKNEVKAYGLSFYKAYLMHTRSCLAGS